MMKRTFVLTVLVIIGIACWGQTVEEARELHQKGYALLDSGDYVQGREYTRQAMEMRRQLLGEVNEDYITSLNNYALSFAMEQNYQRAAELQEQVMALCDKLPSPHPNLGMYMTNMGRYYYMTDNYQAAATAWERALPLVEKFSKIYEFLLNGLSLVYSESDDKKNLEHVMSLMEEHNQHELTLPCDEPQCMLERAQYYAAIKDNAKAKEHFMELLKMKLDDAMKAQAYNAYAKFLFSNNDYVNAAEYSHSGGLALKRAQGENEEYAQMMYRAAVYSFLGQQYQKAIDDYQTVIGFYRQQGSSAALKNIANCLNGMGNAYSGLKNYEKAKECFTKVMEYYQANDIENDEYPKAILRLAKAEKFNNEFDTSIDHHQQAITLMQERGMNNELSDAYSSLKLCYAYANRPMPDMDYTIPDAARDARLRSIIDDNLANLEITRQFLGNLTYAQSLATIAGSYAMLQEYRPAVDYYKQYIVAVRDAIRDEFRLQDENERMITWQDEGNTIQEMQELMVSLPVGQEALMDELAGVIYDAELLSKGILLNSSIEFEKVLNDLGDRKLKATYEQTKANSSRIAELRQNAQTDEELEQLLALSQENQTLLLQLYNGCALLADFTDYISYKWQDVQHALDKNDVAIEFAAIKTSIFDQDNFMAALVLTKDMSHPVALPVCNLAEARMMENHEQLFELSGNPVWGALSQYLAGKKRIFFSADGSFNRVGIEYLLYDGQPLSQQYEVYRLSSTKELCHKRTATPIRQVTLLGDIDYNEAADLSGRLDSEVLEGFRGKKGLTNLDNTKLEVDEIEKLLQTKKNINVRTLMGPKASHTAFNNLNHSNVNVLHIATHGMYHDQQGASDAQSMDNAYLALAGANVSDDGFITAAEIAKMNLRECDLAVLSACETGLGKLGGDGVFGLQRGFKNAGVHTLLMSLKQVHDASTAMMMTAFYRELLKGGTKREALINAQKELRSNGYNDARYWATFILLDALDQ